MAAVPHKPLGGHVTFFADAQRTALETLSFDEGHCIHYHEHFHASHGAYFCQLTIVATKLTLTPGAKPGSFVAPAPRPHEQPLLQARPVAVAVPASVAPPATVLLNKQERYAARMQLMQKARTGLAATPNEHAQAALTRLERNNVAVERARLSEHVYHSDKLPAMAEPEGWHMLNEEELTAKGVSLPMLRDPETGFKAALYESNFEQPPKLVVAFAGTEDKKDIIADLRQGVGLPEKQYNQAMDLVKALVARTDAADLEITGHSLGGGLASAATVVTGAKGYTFNAAGLHYNTVKRPPYEISRAAMKEQGELIDAYRSSSDPLNNAQKASLVTRGIVLPKALGVPRILQPAPQWKHEWGELNNLNPLKSVKAAKTMALDGHGISPQMVDHIEHEKDQDTATLTQFTTS